VTVLGLGVVAAWLLVVTVAYNLVLAHRLAADRDATLRTKAVAVNATIARTPNGRLVVREGGTDEALDAGVWIFAGSRVLEQPARTHVAGRIASDFVARGPGFYDDGDARRLYVRSVVRDGRRVGTVVVAAENAPYRRSRLEALIGSAVVAVLVLFGAWFALRLAIGRALRPVDGMTRQAAHWSEAALTERFGPDQQLRELQDLADTLNGVLDRQTATVRHERRLFAELSHELRTPLSRILAETDLLLARVHSGEQTRAAHEGIRATALVMDGIIETLLSAGRAEIARAPGRAEVRDAIEQLLAQRGPAAAGTAPAAVPVELDLESDLAVGVGGDVVGRILAPLLDNADRYARTRITVVGRRRPDSVTIDVSDDGPGVADGFTGYLFEPGAQDAAGPTHGGAGLGLALARRLARAAAGEVTHEGGSTFRVRLPPA